MNMMKLQSTIPVKEIHEDSSGKAKTLRPRSVLCKEAQREP